MAIKRIQIRRGTTQEWEDVNPVLSDGEFGLEYLSNGNRKLKLGDGILQWNDLNYFIDKQYLLDLIAEASNTETDEKINDLDTLTQSIVNSISEIDNILTDNTNTISTLLGNDDTQDSRLDALENDNQAITSDIENINDRVSDIESQNITARLSLVETKNTVQDSTLLSINNKDAQQDGRIDSLEAGTTTVIESISTIQGAANDLSDRIISVESAQGTINGNIQQLQNKNTEQDSLFSALNQKNTEQDGRLLSLESVKDNQTDDIETINEKDNEQDGRITALETGLDNETTTRENNLSEESTARENADTDLQNQINVTNEDLTTETTNRANADTTLQNQINTISGNLITETNNRTTNDTDLQSQINTISGNLTTETTNRTEADTSLQNQITANLSSFQSHELNTENPHGVSKEQVGLGNVNNTSDIDKPVSTAQQEAITTALTESKSYTDTQIEATVSGTLHYMGSVATFADLPVTNNMFDFWAVLDEGKGYYWFNDEWNILDFSLDLSSYYQRNETDTLLQTKVDKEEGKGLSKNDFTDSYVQMIQALAGDLRVFHDGIAYQSDAYEDILVTRYMFKSDLSVTNSAMSITFDGLIFQAKATSESNLRTEIAAASGTVQATVRRNSFYNANTDGQTAQQVNYTTAFQTIDSTIYVDSNDYSIYQVFVNNHWWEINLWPANKKSVVLMSLERRL
jgi:hypothetical protein